MERETYIKSILNEHLLDGKTYQNIEESEALDILESIEKETWKLLDEYKDVVSSDERDYFRKSFKSNKHHPQFYGTPKVHKNKFPTPFRPVASQCGSVFAVLSIYVDFKLQQLTKFMPNYVKNSSSLLDEIDKLGILPLTAKLFTSDVISMYSNIEAREAIPILEAYLKEFGHEMKKSSQRELELIVKLTKIVMTNNVFKFGSTWWKQLIGRAMGTSCTCIYATILFAYYEQKHIRPKYRKNFLLYKRQIDDILGVWINNPDDPDAWTRFKADLNSFSQLQ